jgi:hypothetical protein
MLDMALYLSKMDEAISPIESLLLMNASLGMLVDSCIESSAAISQGSDS